MKNVRKDLQKEMQDLRFELKMLLRRNVDWRHRSDVLLREVEQKIEDQFAKLASIQSANEYGAIKLRKRVL